MGIIIFLGAVALAIAYWILRRSGGVLRHILAFVLGAVIVFIGTVFFFDMRYPGWSEARNRAMQPWGVAGVASGIVGPLAGMIIAGIGRRRRRA